MTDHFWKIGTNTCSIFKENKKCQLRFRSWNCCCFLAIDLSPCPALSHCCCVLPSHLPSQFLTRQHAPCMSICPPKCRAQLEPLDSWKKIHTCSSCFCPRNHVMGRDKHHLAISNVSRTWCFAGFCACCRSCCVHVAFQKSFNCFVFAQFLCMFARVAIMMCPCCFRNRCKCFARFCACCFHVASMLLSKTFEEPGVFPGCSAWLYILYLCCVHPSFQRIRTWCFARLLCILISCYIHTIFQNVSRT